jgi:hypothetical protein
LLSHQETSSQALPPLCIPRPHPLIGCLWGRRRGWEFQGHFKQKASLGTRTQPSARRLLGKEREGTRCHSSHVDLDSDKG